MNQTGTGRGAGRTSQVVTPQGNIPATIRRPVRSKQTVNPGPPPASHSVAGHPAFTFQRREVSFQHAVKMDAPSGLKQTWETECGCLNAGVSGSPVVASQTRAV